jgi:hypothetical protein
LILVTLLGFAGVPGGTAAGAEATAVSESGPDLSVPVEELRTSLRCPEDLSSFGREIILLVPPTTVNPDEAYGHNFMPAFDALGLPYCSVVLPDRSMGDIQVSSEYVVSAIRRIHAESGRKVQVLGWSQGGTNPRWALRWWPDLRQRVSEYVGIAPSAHGGRTVDLMCAYDCAPSLWQQRYQSNLVRAMNSGGETFPGIDYTVVWTHFEQFLTPAEATTIDGATNIATQDVCPANTADHISIGGYDPVAYAVVLDALTHPGPADPARIDPSVCTQTLAPYVDPVMFPANFTRAMVQIANQLFLAHPHTNAEPPLKAYARDDPR